jgi:hypothetical protein
MDTEREVLLQRAFAKLALFEQLIRLLLRERAAANGQTPEDILRWAEEQKQFFESRMQAGTEVHLTGAIDAFFSVLAADVRSDRGTP